MTELDKYLQGPYKDDTSFLRRLQSTIAEVIPLFYKKSRQADGVTTWPYAISHQVGDRNDSLSASTHCMVLFALDAFTPRAKDHYSFLLGKNFQPCKLTSEVTSRVEAVVTAAREGLFSILKPKKENGTTYLVSSGTYGKDDPFTLTWLTEIAYRSSADSKIRQICAEAATRSLQRSEILDLAESVGAFSEVTGSFLKLRRLHLAMSVNRFLDQQAVPVPDLWRDFDTTIHRQLSLRHSGSEI